VRPCSKGRSLIIGKVKKKSEKNGYIISEQKNRQAQNLTAQ